MVKINFLCENLELWENIGHILRLAEALGVENVFLLGKSTNTFVSHKKRAVNMSRNNKVNIKLLDDFNQVVDLIKDKEIIGIETITSGTSVFDLHNTNFNKDVILVVGSEKKGITEELLSLCSKVLYVPMFGLNRSMNVAMSLAISSYFVKNRIYEHRK